MTDREISRRLRGFSRVWARVRRSRENPGHRGKGPEGRKGKR